MATINKNNGDWMTSFFYEQDLRSVYMNGALNSGFRPGVYNANICLYTNNDINKGSLGLWIFIKKDTTLIFSNNYSQDSSGRFVRDLDSAGTYLIKCVAQGDINLPLVTLSSGTSSTTSEKILGTSSQPAAETFYVTAMMIYDENNSTGYSAPRFRCTIVNPDYNPTISTTSEDTNFYFSTPGYEDYRIPDGSVNYTNRDLISYLFLGAVKDTGYVTGSTYYSTKSGKWLSTDAANTWVNNHVFIGRGFPEYRQNLTSDKILKSPEIIPSSDLKNLYLDAPYVSIRDQVYDSETDWRGVYSDLGETLKFSATNSTKFDLSEKPITESELTSIGSDSVIVSDILFLSSRSRYSNYSGISLKDMYMKTSSEFDYLNDLKFHWYRWFSSCDKEYAMLDPAFEKESDRSSTDTSTITHSNYENGTALAGVKIVPLDVSQSNRDRLLQLIKNRTIIPAIINKMRQEGELDPQQETDLVPAALILRKFTKTESGSWQTVDRISDFTKFNPSNILSYFDLQYRTTKINNLITLSPEAFTIIPVME